MFQHIFSDTFRLLYFLNILELCVLFFACFSGVFLILISFQASIFHRNLALLCVGLYFMASIAITLQGVLVIAGFFDFDILGKNFHTFIQFFLFQCILASEGLFIRQGWGKYVEWVRLAACGGILSFFASIIVERALATKMLKTYELRKSNLLLAVSLIIALFFGLMGSTVIMESKFQSLQNSM